MYHYVRDLPKTPFPRIKGMLTSDFRRQLQALRSRYEMATLEIALDFLKGTYTPSRDLCLLTFDDGLKEHYTDVTPLLVEYKIQGLFFMITACLYENLVVPVHMNHFLMAALDFEQYRTAFLNRLADSQPKLEQLDRCRLEPGATRIPLGHSRGRFFQISLQFRVGLHGSRSDLERSV